MLWLDHGILSTNNITICMHLWSKCTHCLADGSCPHNCSRPVTQFNFLFLTPVSNDVHICNKWVLEYSCKFNCIFYGFSESFPYTCFFTITIDLYFRFLCLVLNEFLSASHTFSAGMVFLLYIFPDIQDYTQGNEQCFQLSYRLSYNFYACLNPFRSYIRPRPTVRFSSSAPMSEDVRHGFCCICSPAVGACPTLFLM
jgi:hypothetical protein